MGKPLGIGLGMSSSGPRMFVMPIDRVSDQIWDAVREAINANMLPEQFRREAAQAWAHYLAKDAKYAAQELTK